MPKQYAQTVLNHYQALQQKSLLKMSSKTSDEAVYVAQLFTLAQEEQREKVDAKVVLGVFLFIYLQIDFNKDNMIGSARDALGIKPCRNLGLALKNSTFTLGGEESTLADIATFFRCGRGVSHLASEALQKAFMFFKSSEIMVDDQALTFFLPDQQLFIYRNNFLCAMLKIKTFSKLENIVSSTENPLYNLNDYFQIIENAAMHLDDLAYSLLKDDLIRDQQEARKFASLLILDTVYLAIKALVNPEFVQVEQFFKGIMGNFFSSRLYVHDKGQEYENIRKNFFFGAMALEDVLFHGVNDQVKQFLAEWTVRFKIPESNVDFSNFKQQISVTTKEALLLNSFVEDHALVISTTVRKPLKARVELTSRAALAAYNVPKTQIQAETRSVYQAQLASMANKEEDGSATEEDKLGLFLLIMLLIQSREISSSLAMSVFRNGVTPLVDAGFDDEKTGSSLERILGQAPCDFSPKVDFVELSVIANSCNASFSSDDHTAYAAKIIQKAFLLMRKEPASSASELGEFFTLEQKQLVYQYSYLCAMQDIFSFVEAEKLAIAWFEPHRSMALNFLKIIENSITCLSTLSEHVAQVFPETGGNENASLRVKSACFLVVFRVYLEVKKTPDLQKLTHSLEFFLRKFFVTSGMVSRSPLPMAEGFIQVFFSQAIISSGLFSGVNKVVYELLLSPAPQQATVSFIKWVKESNFLPTKRDDVLIGDFSSRVKREPEIFSNISTENEAILRAILTRHPEMEGFLSVDFLEDMMKQVFNESLDGGLASLIRHVNEQCNLNQKTRLLNIIGALSSYRELADNLQVICQFDLNIVLEECVVERYINTKIIVLAASHAISPSPMPKSMMLKEQLQMACADRAIIYIYREYFQRPFSILAKEMNISKELLQSNEPYEQWCENKLLKQRSSNDAKKLCEWFKEGRPKIEDWYKRENREYGEHWNDIFLTEVKIRCLLLAENSSLYQDKRTQLTEIFNTTPDMQSILTPYACYEILDSFKHRLGDAVAISGRANAQEKEQALLSTMEGINRDMAGVLLTTSRPSVTGMRLLKSMLNYAEGDEPKYLALLQDLLGSNCPPDNSRGKSDDKIQLEKYFLANALLFNLLGYLFVYAHHDKASLCAWGGVSGVYHDALRESEGHVCWGLVKGAIFDAESFSEQTLEEMLTDTQHHKIDVSNFYEKFQRMLQEVEIIGEDQDLVDVFVPLVPPSLATSRLSFCYHDETSVALVIPSNACDNN